MGGSIVLPLVSWGSLERGCRLRSPSWSSDHGQNCGVRPKIALVLLQNGAAQLESPWRDGGLQRPGDPDLRGDVPPAGHLPVGGGRTGKAPPGHDAEGGLQRCTEAGAREEVPDTEVHQQAGQEETGREAGPQGLAGDLLNMINLTFYAL
ncbi:hypothetical protein AVEN_117601-1 [Araneus ventricosus]|uniref:Uncharacterized protein n=1 Tax=Araneus ventricosus TaxID=182803 RepID=A0A4Y2G7V2_ARAVE|nr:hypothetical protein AVEN_117601-1 [Araneus ventricosus]